MKKSIAAAMFALAGGAAQADSVDTLRAFIRDVKTGSATFTQTVTSADGSKKKTQSGHFDFARPNRFRFAYAKPFEQVIVGDGRKVWIYDVDLNQVSSRKISEALGATPAALLAGSSLDKEFDLAAMPDQGGLAWVRATPKVADGPFRSLGVGFRGPTLAAVEIVDAFGQRSMLDFTDFASNAALPAEAFRFTPPAGADVIEQ